MFSEKDIKGTAELVAPIQSKKKAGSLEIYLVVDGKRFYNNADSESHAEIIIEALRKIDNRIFFFVEDFNVVFNEDYPTGKTKKWRKEKGFSIWYVPPSRAIK